MRWYQQRPEGMQTDLNCINLWEEKYKNKAVLIALTNSLYFFFCDDNCDNYHLLWPFFVQTNVLILNDKQSQKIGIVSVLQLKKLRLLVGKKLHLCVLGKLSIHDIEHIPNIQQK